MKVRTNFFLTALICLMVGFTYGQTFKEKSDPEATKILKNLKKVYGKYEGLYIKYSLELEYGEEREIQEGEILQAGDRFRLNNDGNLIINDGKTVWVYVKKQNEVQINDYIPDEDELFSPAKILNIDENDKDFVYAITGEDSRGYKIEFKPRDKESEVMKIRLRVDKAQSKILSVKLFSKDGTRMNFTVKSIKNVPPKADDFKFNKAAYPGVEEIDMRD